jgi:Flp pilus assembly protein TadG
MKRHTSQGHATMITRFSNLLARLRRNRRGNVLMIFAFAMVPMVFATGMGVDYTRAARLQTKMNAIADAAALSAVTQPMMLQSEDAATAAARAMFIAQSNELGSDLVFDGTNPDDLTITVTPVYNATSPGRVATVTWKAESQNAFGGILGRPTIPIAGTSTSTADKAPYINFYLLLDTSPSMLLPTTTSGLNQMRSQTSTSHLSNGCAFACHAMNPHSDNIYVQDRNGKDIWLNAKDNYKAYAVDAIINGYVYSSTYSGTPTQIAPFSNGYYADAYWMAHNNATFPTSKNTNNIEMRIDAEQTAVQSLVPTAKQIADDNHVMYRMAVNRFDYYGPTTSGYGPVVPLTDLSSDANVQSVVNAATNLPLTYWWSNSNISSTQNINDQSTNFYQAFDQMNKLMPTPGTGQTANDPQEVMFIITDGMSDENLNGSRTHSQLLQTHIDQCTAIKSRNIRIAILYTAYLPESLTGDPWSISNVQPVLVPTDKVAQQLQACASPGLYQMVSTDASIPDALNALFRQAVASAHLTQ